MDQGSESHDRPRRSFWARLRNYFITGIIVVAPIALTIYLVTLVVGFIDESILPLLGERYNPETYLPFAVPGIGVLIFVIAITLIGWIATGLVGRTVVRVGENLLDRMPVIRSVYSALKQIFETVLAQNSRAFRDVVLIPYPRQGCWAIGFVTGTTRGEVKDTIQDEVVNVFLPTTPNPTSGYLLFLPKKDVIFLRMNVEQGIKLVISGGVVTPDVASDRPDGDVTPAPGGRAG
ncbi:MAG: DUF502 domain-containing protein [Rhodospirillales bacterium]|nr:DUF502 domain-containing protein [Rhodospirillales bacterium]